MVISRKDIAQQQVGTTSSKASPTDISQELNLTSVHIQMGNIMALRYLKKTGGDQESEND